ncbi:MAG: transporter, partial [Candidatus Aminicenantes bacterium]|nr:transporter [Candidatus Aminicenantes bacterium]
MNFLVLGYGYSQGDVLVDPTLPIKDLNARIHLPILAYVRSLNVWGRSGKFDIVLPFAWLSGSGKIGSEDETRRRS